MSSDNGIYILQTTSMWHESEKNGVVSKWSDHSTRPVWRVAHAMAIENIDWYKENQPYNLGAYLVEIWGKSPVFYNKEEALKYASKLHNDHEWTEYGISSIQGYEQYRFFGD